MNLFDECKEALGEDFNIVEGHDCDTAIFIFNQYPIINGNISWPDVGYIEYENIKEFVRKQSFENNHFFVLVDDASIPVFRTSTRALSENVCDITALSPKIFIFNDEVILQPLFPTDKFRAFIKGECK